MKREDIQEKLIKEIKQADDLRLLEIVYRILTAENGEGAFALTETQRSAIEEASEHSNYGRNLLKKQPIRRPRKNILAT